ncbi:MAG: homocysteine biosynthesis protein [Deltaproteobacteria bacterium]|nr:homocysteine biosynthesis protein [Deltaproteobacteria bacterium]MBW1846188.1 homocysteine biosynthesis protein [Deltaproteobacteria bacterium]MBW2179640.1 homocysteine biosynthesis protein [Deltaproteobacteria bacterium]MBW2364755.1 homocysteine biosynthesis protein [Deltaproteobacteria bacterium]
MGKTKVNKTYKEINEKIKSGKVVVVTAEEIIDIVKDQGPVNAAKHVDVVTTGTFAPMCSSGVLLNFGHSAPTIKASKVWMNNVPAYAGIAAVDCYLGATEPCEDDPLNKVYPGEFKYGGGHVIQDLVAGKRVHLRATAYGTSCYPRRELEKEVSLRNLPHVTLCNPRNGYQNYNCAVNLSKKTIYTYMGTLKPKAGNANYCSAGQLSPLFNDPFYQTIGIGTRIFLGGGEGYVTWFGTQHKPEVKRTKKGIPVVPAGTMWVMGDLKQMSPEWLVGVSIQGYGCSLSVGLGVPIPILNEEIVKNTAVTDEDIFTQIIDYGNDYPTGTTKSYGQVSYAELKSGMIKFNGKEVPTVPLSSVVKARDIANSLKEWISKGKFFIGEPQFTLPG